MYCLSLWNRPIYPKRMSGTFSFSKKWSGPFPRKMWNHDRRQERHESTLLLTLLLGDCDCVWPHPFPSKHALHTASVATALACHSNWPGWRGAAAGRRVRAKANRFGCCHSKFIRVFSLAEGFLFLCWMPFLTQLLHLWGLGDQRKEGPSRTHPGCDQAGDPGQVALAGNDSSLCKRVEVKTLLAHVSPWTLCPSNLFFFVACNPIEWIAETPCLLDSFNDHEIFFFVCVFVFMCFY